MLTFRNTNIVFGALIGILLLIDVWFNIPWHLYLGAAMLYGVVLFYGSYNVSSNFFMKVVCSGDTKDRVIAISFDDGPVPKYTPEVLKVLKEQNVPAAFFCIGKRVEENEVLFRQLYHEGHLIGNHSYFHAPLFDLLPFGSMLKDVQQADAAIRNAVGVEPKLFRPPYGVTTPAMNKVMRLGQYVAVGWNVRSLDTTARDETKLLKKLVALLRPGAIILLHDTQRITASVLPHFIRAARNEGYEFVRLDKLLNVRSYA